MQLLQDHVLERLALAAALGQPQAGQPALGQDDDVVAVGEVDAVGNGALEGLHILGLEDDLEEALGLGGYELGERLRLPQLTAVVLELHEDRLLERVEELEAARGDRLDAHLLNYRVIKHSSK